MNRRIAKLAVAALLVVTLIGGVTVVARTSLQQNRIHVTGYFANSNGIFPGDDVRILGIPVGKIDRITEEPSRVRIDFWYDARYQVPATANAVVLAPALVAVRAIQLTPAYTGGPMLADGAVLDQQHTAVPVEWDDFRAQLQKLTESLQPTEPGGVSTLGHFINTTADNLRGEGDNIRDTIIKLSQAFSALGDHSTDIFSTVKNISILVSALQASTGLMKQLNENLAAVTGVMSNTPNEIGAAITDINSAVGLVQDFVANNKDSIGTTSDTMASITTTLNQSLDDIKQTLHILPNAVQNFLNIYQPAQGALTGALALHNFADPISFLCGAVQAASRLGAEQSAKLCVQYLAPIVKNRQYNFPPVGFNPFVGTAARPNEVTYSEDRLRPDYVPPPAQVTGAEVPAPPPLPAERQQTDPAAGLQGMLVPNGAGS